MPQPTPREIVDSFLPREPLFRFFGIDVADVGEGTARLVMKVREDMLNAQAVCHGGMVFLLADSALGMACNSRNQRAVTASCAIDYLRPALAGETLVAVATEITHTRRSGLYDIRVETTGGELVAVLRGRSATIAGTHL
jgi:acyl-CoA thioesterase